MTKGLTRLASHNSNMVAPGEHKYEGGWTIYHTRKSCRALKQEKKKTISSFDCYLDNSSQYNLFAPSSSDSSTSTGTGALYPNIVKGTIHNPYPPMKIKTKFSDQDSTCSETTEDPTIMICTPKVHKPKISHKKSVPIFTKKHNNHDKIMKSPRAAHPNVIPHKHKYRKINFYMRHPLEKFMLRIQELKLERIRPQKRTMITQRLIPSNQILKWHSLQGPQVQNTNTRMAPQHA